MKKLTLLVFCTTTLSLIIHAQSQTPQLLKQPANWQFERFALPPQFAPAIRYKGAEELRFAPGMFAKDSADYFTYAFVAALENISSLSQAEIKTYLLDYYKGLCSSTAKQRKLSIDTALISVAIRKEKSMGAAVFYKAKLHLFGVFADGAPVRLNMRIKVLTNKRVSKTFLVFIASPLNVTSEIWRTLQAVQAGFTIPER